EEWAEPRVERGHALDERQRLAGLVRQMPAVADLARDLEAEAERLWRLSGPALNNLEIRHGVERGVALNGREPAAVERQEIAALAARWEEIADPVLVAP